MTKGLDKVKEESMENQAEQSMEDYRRNEFNEFEGYKVHEITNNRDMKTVVIKVTGDDGMSGKTIRISPRVEVSKTHGLLVYLDVDANGNWGTLQAPNLGGSNEGLR